MGLKCGLAWGCVCQSAKGKKKSGRWGDRPLGRGELRVYGLKPAGLIVATRWARSGPFCCAREQQDDAQEQTPDNHPNGSE